MPADLAAFEKTFQFAHAGAKDRLARLWQLTNTRYLVGPAKFLDSLNNQLDPVQRRFQTAHTFDLVPASGITQPARFEDLTAAFKTDGPYAIFEFKGALPRAKLYPRWLVNTNEQATLEELSNPEFDPEQTVLVNSLPAADQGTEGASDADAGSVEFTSYRPKEIVLQTRAKSVSVLLLNDRFDPRWSVTVDSKPAQLLRCNYLVRGVQVPAGSHTVKFSFQIPFSLPFAQLDVEPDTQAVSFVFHIPTGVPSYFTLFAYGAGLVLLLFLALGRRKQAARNRSAKG
jgi:hypothetical protein